MIVPMDPVFDEGLAYLQKFLALCLICIKITQCKLVEWINIKEIWNVFLNQDHISDINSGGREIKQSIGNFSTNNIF